MGTTNSAAVTNTNNWDGTVSTAVTTSVSLLPSSSTIVAAPVLRSANPCAFVMAVASVSDVSPTVAAPASGVAKEIAFPGLAMPSTSPGS